MIELFVKRFTKCINCTKGLTGALNTCYACNKNLVGEKKRYQSDEYWECTCREYKCECKEKENFYCPLCSEYFGESEYLRTVIANVNTLWIANFITHYRHKHITSWDKRWNGTYKGGTYRLSGIEYDIEKQKTNERAKRQLLRKAGPFLIKHGVNLSDFKQLKENDPKTLELAKKVLGE